MPSENDHPNDEYLIGLASWDDADWEFEQDVCFCGMNEEGFVPRKTSSTGPWNVYQAAPAPPSFPGSHEGSGVDLVKNGENYIIDSCKSCFQYEQADYQIGPAGLSNSNGNNIPRTVDDASALVHLVGSFHNNASPARNAAILTALPSAPVIIVLSPQTTSLTINFQTSNNNITTTTISESSSEPGSSSGSSSSPSFSVVSSASSPPARGATSLRSDRNSNILRLTTLCTTRVVELQLGFEFHRVGCGKLFNSEHTTEGWEEHYAEVHLSPAAAAAALPAAHMEFSSTISQDHNSKSSSSSESSSTWSSINYTQNTAAALPTTKSPWSSMAVHANKRSNRHRRSSSSGGDRCKKRKKKSYLVGGEEEQQQERGRRRVRRSKEKRQKHDSTDDFLLRGLALPIRPLYVDSGGGGGGDGGDIVRTHHYRHHHRLGEKRDKKYENA